MTSRLKFRNLDVDPAAPVSNWPDQGIQAALERGSLSDYRRIAAEIRSDPWGDVARRVERVLGYTNPYGTGALFRQVITNYRAQAEATARAEVARQLAAALAASGLSQAAFAARLGTSPSRMSTYLRGVVTPSASLLIRAQQLSARAARPETG
ncbi:MAG TPA: helix-turn-helix transcriptional regulator [Jatrophihabitans sp.]|nr:helix-turn-helix transcriptional regulator [Jatrophihabitans sp.]